MEDFEDQNQELLDTLEKTDPEPVEIKMGTKQHIISEIVKVSEKTGTSGRLTNVLTTKDKTRIKNISWKHHRKSHGKRDTEKVKFECATNGEHRKTRSISGNGVLRMLHDSVARGTEAMCEKFTPYSIDGFSERMRDPQVSEQIDSILLQIAGERRITTNQQPSDVENRSCCSTSYNTSRRTVILT